MAPFPAVATQTNAEDQESPYVLDITPRDTNKIVYLAGRQAIYLQTSYSDSRIYFVGK